MRFLFYCCFFCFILVNFRQVRFYIYFWQQISWVNNLLVVIGGLKSTRKLVSWRWVDKFLEKSLWRSYLMKNRHLRLHWWFNLKIQHRVSYSLRSCCFVVSFLLLRCDLLNHLTRELRRLKWAAHRFTIVARLLSRMKLGSLGKVCADD